MAVELASGYVSLIPSTKDIGSAISREMSTPIENAANQTSNRVGGTFKKLAAVVGGVFAAKVGVDVFKGFIAQAEESRKVGAQTAAALKSTGGAAQVTAKQVGELANAISMKTGVDDEAIQSGENLLLTFTNIQNRAGKGNDVFNQSTQILTDMAAALGGDVSSNAIQLGKALNDPVAGISALTRVGVTFSDQQKNTIKQMVATGNVAGAQKVILGELNKEFGGSAAAQATAGKKLSVIWGNIQEQLGGYLLPIVDKVASWLGDRLPGAINRAAGIIGPFVQKVQWLAEAFVSAFSGEGITESSGIFNVVERLGIAFRKVVDGVKAFVYSLTTGFTQDEGTPIERIALVIRNIALPAFQAITSWVQDHMTVSLIALGIVVAALIGPVLGTTAVVAALVAGVIYAYNHFTIFRTIVDGVVGFFRDVLIPAVQTTAAYIADQVGHLADWWRANWTNIQEATRNVLIVIAAIVAAFIAPFIFVWQHAGDQILAIVGVVFDQIKNVVETGVRIIRDIVTFFVALLSGDWGKAWDAIRDIPAAVFDFMIGTVRNAIRIIGDVILGAGKVIGAAAVGMFDGIKDAFRAAINFIIRGWNGLEFKMPEVDTHIPGIGKVGGFTLGVPDIPQLAAGAVIKHRTNGTPAILGEGRYDEAVVPLRQRSYARIASALSGASMPSGGPTKHYELNLGIVPGDQVDVQEQFRRMELLSA